MEQSKVDQIIAKSGSYLPSSKLSEIKQKLEQTPDEKFDSIIKTTFRSGIAMFFLAFFLIGLGLDRFMTGSKKVGIIRIISFIAYYAIFVANRESTISETEVILPVVMIIIGLWWLIELFTTFSRAKKYNYQKLNLILTK